LERRSFSAFYLKGDQVLAVDTVNRVPEFMLAKRLVAERIAVDADRLVDEGVPLKNLLPAA
jgi:3-phenylpropionate/trans-cinnamate dioxygenase ferredoxin reductase subunit